MKAKLEGSLGVAGSVIFYLISCLLVVAPLWFIGLPWWADLLIIALILSTNIIGGVISVALWVWALVIVVSGTIGWLEIVFFVLFAVYLFFTFIPAILQMIRQLRP